MQIVYIYIQKVFVYIYIYICRYIDIYIYEGFVCVQGLSLLRSEEAGSGFEVYRQLEPLITNYTPNFRGCLDYIFYSPSRLQLLEILQPLEEHQLIRVSSNQGLLGFSRVYQGLLGFMRVYEGLVGFMRVYQGLLGFMRVQQGLLGFIRVYGCYHQGLRLLL